jgi:PPOX class probable F420-dependent enzyme
MVKIGPPSPCRDLVIVVHDPEGIETDDSAAKTVSTMRLEHPPRRNGADREAAGESSVRRNEALALAAAARVARLATVRPDGGPHVVPIVFVLLDERDGLRLYWAVDDKPKRSTRLTRLENIRTDPRVEVVVDAYDEDWSKLWWVRFLGAARVVAEDAERDSALEALAGKYAPYRLRQPSGDVVAIDVTHVRWWTGSPPDPR